MKYWQKNAILPCPNPAISQPVFLVGWPDVELPWFLFLSISPKLRSESLVDGNATVKLSKESQEKEPHTLHMPTKPYTKEGV